MPDPAHCRHVARIVTLPDGLSRCRDCGFVFFEGTPVVPVPVVPAAVVVPIEGDGLGAHFADYGPMLVVIAAGMVLMAAVIVALGLWYSR